MRIKFLAALAAVSALVFVPTAAQAVVTTLDVQNNGSVATTMEDNDTLDVVVQGPIAQTGVAVHELYSSWSGQSLELDDIDDIVYPEGWTLEFTTNGTTWSETAPGDVSTIVAIRAVGDVNTVGENAFRTTSDAQLMAPASFAGSGGGDGYDVAVGNNKVFNFWHHQEGTVTMECHTFTGELCETGTLSVDGYSSNHGSRAFSNDANNRVYAFVLNDTTQHFGVMCFNYDVTPAVSCGFTELETNGPSAAALAADAIDEGAVYQDTGSASQDGDIIWTITGAGELICFNIATAAACADNGWDTTYTDYAFDTGRVTAVGGKVFFTLANKLGCYDTVTDGLCGGSAAITLTDTANRHAPVPYENQAGVFVGVCDFYTGQCIQTTGNTFGPSAAWTTFYTNNPVNHAIGRQNAEQFAYSGNRLYYETTIGGAFGWSTQISCFDFITAAACAGFDGDIDGLDTFYSVSIDQQFPNCAWLNQDSGVIIPINATTGAIGCDLGSPVVELPYDAVTPRMSCDAEGRVIEWESITVNPTPGVTMSDVRVSFYDNNGDAVDGWTEMTPNASGFIALTSLTVDQTSTTPSIRITAGSISEATAELISATVQFVAEDPQLCFALNAANNCPTTISDSPAPGSIADGIVEGASVTRPAVGIDVGSRERTDIQGLNAEDMCLSSAIEIPMPALADTGANVDGLALAGFGVLALGAGAMVVSRRRAI